MTTKEDKKIQLLKLGFDFEPLKTQVFSWVSFKIKFLPTIYMPKITIRG
jgi:hypothetical protein